jgi:hypothetical protein
MRGSRFVHRALAALACIVALSACRVDTDVSTVVNPDGSGTVTVQVTADAEVVVAEPNLAKELQVDDLVQSGWQVTGPVPTADNGLTVQLKHPFKNLAEANEILASLSGPDGPILEPMLAAKGSRGEVHWTFVGSLDFSKGLNAIADQDLITAVGQTPWIAELANRQLTPTDAASVTFRVTLPGKASSGVGKTAATTTNEWTVRPGDAALDLDLESVQVSKGVKLARKIEGQFKVILIVYLLIVGGLAAIWFYARSKRNRPKDVRPPMKMAEMLELQPDERRVMRYLLRFDSPPNAEELAQAVGISVRELKDHVRVLLRAGLVVVEQGRVRPVTGKRSSRLSNNDRWSKLDDM